MNKIQKFFTGLLGLKGLPITGGRVSFVNGTVVWISNNTESYINEGYKGNDIVYSALKMVEERVKIAPWAQYKIVDETALKQYKTYFKAGDYTSAEKYQRKSLELITNFNFKTGKWKELLEWPNESETWGDFVSNGAAYKMLTGNKFWWADILHSGANSGLPNSLHALPPQFTSIIAKTGWPCRVLGYQLNSGQVLTFEIEDVLHEKYFNPSYDINGSHLYGQSPLQAATKNLTRNNYAKIATTKKFENGGMDGVIFIDEQLATAEERLAQAKEVKKIITSNEYSGAESSGKTAVSGYKTGFTKIGDTAKDLMTLQFEDLDLRRLANIWGIPSQLLNDPENKAQANVVEAERSLTSRCVLPQLTSCRDNLNKKNKEWGIESYIDFDLSVYRELQEDQSKKWEWVKQLTVPEVYKLELMGLDVPDELPKDLIIIDGNKMTLEDLMNRLTVDQQNQVNNVANNAGI